MPFKPVPQPPPVSPAFDPWINTLYQQTVKRIAWTPVMTYATPGTFSVVVTTALGDAVQFPNGYVIASFFFQGVPTNGTAASALEITGLPFTPASDVTSMQWQGAMGQWSGITKAGYTQMAVRAFPGLTLLGFVGSGSGVAASTVVVADVPSGGTVILAGQLAYRT